MRLAVRVTFVFAVSASLLVPSRAAAQQGWPQDAAVKKPVTVAKRTPSASAKPSSEAGAIPPAVPADVLRRLESQANELSRLAGEIRRQQQLIDEQQNKITQLEARGTGSVVERAPEETPVVPALPALPARPIVVLPASPPPAPIVPTPLTLKVGDAELLLGGFMDATAVTRSTNHGSGLGTSFGTIPFANTPQGGLSETRLSTQNSRVTLQATSAVGDAALKGYIEADFLGNPPATLAVTSNSNTLRMRLYWAQLSTGTWEVLGGQSWSLLTPNRNGLSPAPGDLFYSQVVDTNYQMGLTWSRTTQFRFVAHLPHAITAGASLENPQQYVGSGVVLPAAFQAAEVDVTGNTAAPNPYPDVIAKIAFDPKTAQTHQHVDAAFVLRGYKTYNATTGASFTANGTGVAVNAVLEPTRAVHLVANAFLSNGGGRYISNTNTPDFIVDADGRPGLVAARSGIGGIEVQAGGKTLVYGYYSLALADQNVAIDGSGKSIGFGVAGSTFANRRLEETTVGVTQTFFRDPRRGGVQLMLQYSQLARTPFAVPSGTPVDAAVRMLFANVRYLLP